MAFTMDELSGLRYMIKEGEWITVNRMRSPLHPVPVKGNRVGVYVMEGSRSTVGDTMYTFTLTQTCKRHLRVTLLPDSIKEKIAWAMVQNPIDPLGDTIAENRDFSTVADDDMGIRLNDYQLIIYLTRDEYFWLYSAEIQHKERDALNKQWEADARGESDGDT